MGLLRQLREELEGDNPPTMALIGDIGSGKTTALHAYLQRASDSSATSRFIWLDAGKMDSAQQLHIHKHVYLELVAALGEQLHDEVVRDLAIRALNLNKHLDPSNVFKIIKAMVGRSAKEGRRVHLLVDECQRPAEDFERAGNTAGLHSWFELLKNLAEALSGGSGSMVITMTTSPWDSAPPHARARFVELRAEPPTAEEIESFLAEGLSNTGGERPDQLDPGLGAAIKDRHPELITLRELHAVAWRMWSRAERAGAATLSRSHMG